jgi:hypothetical protein
MIRTVPCLALLLVAVSGSTRADEGYRLVSGSQAQCTAFLNRKGDLERVKPLLRKTDSRWTDYTARCPAFLKKERWMSYPNREFDDYALYSIDVDNDGKKDTVLYRRHDKEYFVTHQTTDRREYRKQDGLEVSEEYFKVDASMCTMERIFAGYERIRLVRLDGVTYIEKLHPRDRAQTLEIYRKQADADLKTGQDVMCRYQR